MSEHVYFLTIGLPLVTVLLIFGMKYFAQIQQARADQEREAMLQQLVIASHKTQQETADALKAIQRIQASLDTRVAEVERILKQVE